MVPVQLAVSYSTLITVLAKLRHSFQPSVMHMTEHQPPWQK